VPASDRTQNSKKKSKQSNKGAQLDIVFGGPLLFVPISNAGAVTSIDVYCPKNGHPMGAVFLPGSWYSDDELNDPQCNRWPEATSLSLLDPHSYAINLTQSLSKKHRPFAVSTIPAKNHKVRPGRKLSSDWEVAINVNGHLSEWASHRLIDVKEGFYGGSDAPTTAMVAGMHRLTYHAVIAAEFAGASREAKEYLAANVDKGGTLIILGEIPYQSTLLHERQAISSLARLAGLDLHLFETNPRISRTHVMNHTTTLCIHSVIVTDPGE
jgi:hypothetical protein